MRRFSKGGSGKQVWNETMFLPAMGSVTRTTVGSTTKLS
jgi:hypothetical protein